MRYVIYRIAEADKSNSEKTLKIRSTNHYFIGYFHRYIFISNNYIYGYCSLEAK